MDTGHGADLDFQSFDMDAESFRKAGYEMIDMLAEYFSSIRDVRITSASGSAAIEKIFEEQLPGEGLPMHAILQDWQQRAMPHVTHLGSPRYFGFVNGSGTMPSVFAAAIACAVNMNSGGWKAGPCRWCLRGSWRHAAGIETFIQRS